MNKKEYSCPSIKLVTTDDLMQDEGLHNSVGDGNQLDNAASFDDENDNGINTDIITHSVWDE